MAIQHPSVKLIGTHNQVFHADDVFAVATLKQLFPAAKIIRTRDKSLLESCDLIVDVGGIYDHSRMRYDHHQNGYNETHKNGILRSGFGLVWKHYGQMLSGSSYIAAKIDDSLVATVDALDNGQALCPNSNFGQVVHTISDFIENHNPIGHNLSLATYDEAFFKIVPTAGEYITTLIKKYKAKQADNKLFKQIYNNSSDKKIVVLDATLDSSDAEFAQPELLYVVYPRADANWNVKAIALDATNKFVNRLPLPQPWRGLRDEQLSQASGVKTAVFCHRTGFMAVARTKDDAVLLAKKSIETQL